MVSMTTEYSKEQVIGLAVSFMILPLIFYALRIWARLLISRFTLDDYLAGGGLVFSTICCSLQLAAAIEGRLGTHQVVLPDGTPDMNDPGLAFFENSKFAMNMLSILGLGLIKCSILVLYHNLFPSTTFRWFIWAALAYVGIWTVSFFFSHLFTCFPITTFIDFFEGKTCVNQSAMFLSVLYTGVVADFVILLLPMPMIWSLQMRMKMKLAVIGMLSLGAATCAIGVARVIAISGVAAEYQKHPNDIIYYTAPVFYWTNIELSMAVVCACLPTLRPIWFHFYPKAEATGNKSYEYGYGANASRSSRKTGGGGGGGALGNNRGTPYTEIDDDVELGDRMHMGGGAGAGDTGAGASFQNQIPGAKDIVKQTIIAQTVDDAIDSSSTTDLRPMGGAGDHGGMWTPVRTSRRDI